MKLADVSPITELKRDAASLIRKAAKQRSPIVITQNGKATAILQGAGDYEEDQRAFALLRLAVEGNAILRKATPCRIGNIESE